jgi:hypothetical protein
MVKSKYLLAAAVLALSVSAAQAVPVLASCGSADVSVAGASCLGFFSGNLNGNKPSVNSINTDLKSWNFSLTGAVDEKFQLSNLGVNNQTHAINFDQLLYGDTIVGIHYGNVTGANGVKSNNVTAFYRFDAGTTGLDSFTTKFASLSNATLYLTGPAPLAPTTPVPEPATYAMLLGGLGMMGFVARRKNAVAA